METLSKWMNEETPSNAQYSRHFSVNFSVSFPPSASLLILAPLPRQYLSFELFLYPNPNRSSSVNQAQVLPALDTFPH